VRKWEWTATRITGSLSAVVVALALGMLFLARETRPRQGPAAAKKFSPIGVIIDLPNDPPPGLVATNPVAVHLMRLWDRTDKTLRRSIETHLQKLGLRVIPNYSGDHSGRVRLAHPARAILTGTASAESLSEIGERPPVTGFMIYRDGNTLPLLAFNIHISLLESISAPTRSPTTPIYRRAQTDETGWVYVTQQGMGKDLPQFILRCVARDVGKWGMGEK